MDEVRHLNVVFGLFGLRVDLSVRVIDVLTVVYFTLELCRSLSERNFS
jgi:hypothetical protein